MKTQLSTLLADHLDGISPQEIMTLLEIPPSPEMGDFALPCFSFAKKLRQSPVKIALDLKNRLKSIDGIERMEAVGGYLNFYADRKLYVQRILNRALSEDYGASDEGSGKTICMDYSSPNIAKNFHVGHLRTTVIGNSLYRIYSKLGYQVVRINHLGDWGTQFGKLIVAYHNWSSREAVEAGGIEELLRIYVKFNEEAAADPSLTEEARLWFARMEQGNEEALDIWKWFRKISMKEFDRVYRLLGISFDHYTGESFYVDKVPALVKELQNKQLLEESQGAEIVNLSAYDMPPCLITKANGSTIYHSRDLAAILYRKKEYHFEKCLYVTGLEQSLHFAQLFKVIELMGYDWYTGLVHVPYGLVSLKGARLSTRSDNIIYAEDILKEAIDRAAALIQEKNPALPNKEETAAMVGVGAIIFHDLYNQRIKNVDFSWDEVLNFEGSTGPYVQYTYARAKSILRKAVLEEDLSPADCCPDFSACPDAYAALTDAPSFALVKLIGNYPDIIREAAGRYEPSVIARYSIDLAVAFNRFYHDCRILNAEPDIRRARLLLVSITQKLLKDSLALLGIQSPEEM